VPGAAPSDLASLPIFDALTASELDELAPWFEVREVPPGVRLVGEGATGRSFFVISDGEAAVVADGRELATLHGGDFFGEVALLGEGRRTATVTTTRPTRLLVLFGNDFARLRSKHPAVAAALEAAAQRRLSAAG
jgi:voltage-gated potassium channel